jgi:LL-diaminopimelate aminotransferase
MFTLPLAGAVISAMHNAVSEMGNRGTFRGYGEEQGYSFFGKLYADIIPKRE